ncbi:flavin reductase family protein [Paraburkholderia sp. DD10]|jgi:flavin reductase (DIM6/NTAB) family NADH-FMN oxidoreductase RutF|uniref:Flavin reductase (DIM6/NTAB) family NADH-FMN oxidoreductase RutF n=1 Tax=Paraburkholderia terricola TaxID=169427 RepID=A0A1M6KCT9_9BURK|nr:MULTISPECIES: flavin reductase family protein [Paraburkholderia]AXE96046.1 flavin reductase [Paraburkholderia terricola]MDR6406909.1 flavin reductase (DIM6/NTAB) family NADH-FMN oxidoreductase RutF [Paraburkholderia terricola]MDR6479412.1 flavin reductase (DIM6/NTAB) family NADH-FMN oxidoreductase RutF [Paraburkholderia terricola]SDN70182.1 NADH-FMN oxidoreductase RutF, flavin reductase (DIM6/NTAB) family [Paraburkholderia sediminicola]SHJ56776.1 NADH-FMN oxidoreductase RutF, flavin reducta
MKDSSTQSSVLALPQGAFNSKEQSAEWRETMADFPSGVTIVTAMENGRPLGSTVSAFCSLSLRPRLLLVCMDLRSHTLAAINKSHAFAVNILSDRAQSLALKFGAKDGDKFSDVDYEIGDMGCPLLTDCCVNIECRLGASYIEGDHAILTGQPERIVREPTRSPLVYHRGAFRA